MATKRFNFKFHCEKDADIIQRLADQDNMQDYIRLLIRSDILADSINLTLATPDQERERETARQNYYEENCKVFCSGSCGATCKHIVNKQYGMSACTIEEDFNQYWEGVKDHGTN